MQREIEAMVPISIDLDWPKKDEIVKCILEQNARYGFKTFLLAAPGAGWRSFGYPDTSVFVNLAQLFKEVKAQLADKDIQLAWWDSLTIKSGRSNDFQPIVQPNGNLHLFANCPLDETFREVFAKNVAAFAKIAKPAFIVFEDDYAVCAATGYGCFCPLHVAEFSKREGKEYTREELVSIFQQKDENALALYKRYRTLTKDSLVGLAKRIRQELDKETPEIPMGLMQPGCSDQDGDSTYEVCRALAGDKHTPFSRFYGAFYCGGESKNIPKTMYHALYAKEHTKGDFKFYHESDTFPHTRFFSSAQQMKAFMGIAYSSGFIGSVFQTQQLLDDPNEERAYGLMFSSERKRFSRLIHTIDQCQRIGVSLPYDPFYNTVDGGDPNPYWTRTLDLFGIPYTTKNADIVFLDERQAKYASIEQLKEYLSHPCFLDGDAAYQICRRGLGKYLGVDVGENIAQGMIGYDLGAREIFEPPFDRFSQGKNMPIAHMFANGGNGILRSLTPLSEKTEIVSAAYTFHKERLTTAMTYFENELGGQIIVMGMTIKGNLSQSLFNYRRMHIFRELLTRCGATFPLVKDEPCVHLICNQAIDEKAARFSHLVTLINLSDDTVENLALRLPKSMQKKELFCLEKDGEWKKAPYQVCDDGIILQIPLALCEPVYLLFQ